MKFKKILAFCLLQAPISVWSYQDKNFAVIITPVVIPDIISLKSSFEIKIHQKINLLIPLEGKYMNYAWFKAHNLYGDDKTIQPGWNFNFSQLKISSGLGLKGFLLGNAVGNGFFIKTAMLVGLERFNAFSREGVVKNAVFTHNFSLGYSWLFKNNLIFGLEIGEEYTWHTKPIRNLPILISGFNPFLHMNFGFAF